MSLMSYLINFSGVQYILCTCGHTLLPFLVNKHPDSPKRGCPLCVNLLYVNMPAYLFTILLKIF